MQNYGSRNQLKPISNQYSQNQSPLSKNPKSMNAIKSQMFTVESYVDRYKHAFKEGNEVKNRDWQGLVKANEYLRECLRDLNFQISKKVEKQRDQIYQKFTSQSASGSLAKKSEEQIIEQQIAVLNQEYKNNSFILIQQEKELKNIDSKLMNVSQNQQFSLMQKIEQLQDSIKKERLEIKQNRQFNFLEGKYLDNVVNNNQLPKVVEMQQSKQLDSLKLQNTNQKLREQINKKEEIINEYAKKIQSIDKDFREALQNEKQFKIVDQELLAKIKIQRKKVQQLEDNIELIKHNMDREKMRFDGIQRDLKTLIQHTDDKINDIEMKTRQINNDLAQLRQVGTEVSPTFQQRFPQEDIRVSQFDERENNQQFSSVQSSKQQSRNVQSSPIKPSSSKSKSQKSLVKPDKISSNTNLKPKNVNKSTDDFSELQKNQPEAHQQKYSESKPNFTQKKNKIGKNDDFEDEFVQNQEKALQKQQVQDVEKNKQDISGIEVGEDDIENSNIKSKPQLTPIKQQQKQSQEAQINIKEKQNETEHQLKENQIENVEKQVVEQQIQQQQHESQKVIKKQNSDLDDQQDQNQDIQHKKQDDKIQYNHHSLQQVEKQHIQQEAQKQAAQQEVKKKPLKVDSGMQFDHDSPSNKQHNKQEKDMNRLNTEDIQNQITEIKNSSKEEKAQNIKSIQDQLSEIHNNINKIEQQSVKNDNKSLNSISNQNTAQQNKNLQQNGVTKKGEDDIDLDEDLDKIEEEIRRLEEEMQNKDKQTQQKENQEENIQQKQPSKVELAPIKKPAVKKETSFTQTDQAENKNEIFQYKNKESLSNIKEIHETNQQKSKVSMNQQEPNKRNSQVQLNPISQQNQIDQHQNQNSKKSLPHLEPIKQPLQNNKQQKSKINYDDLDFDDSADLLDDAHTNKNQNNPKSSQNDIKNQSNQNIQANNAQVQNIKANNNNQNHNNFKNDDSFDLDLLQDSNVKKNEQKTSQKQIQYQQQSQSNIQQQQNSKNNNNNNKDLDLEFFD
ncbi:hypothetical protein TTHERM_00790800 (macronuclear) [Tetrahymena thermophila SB210]|uniref:Uncharacterized protein n=1 Tax=Tetrahymena thermophila (strain SB210) TaxID=312017 RepID=Q24DQ7_TETTS|nr:hypothetical protein TTHERM_00790800 [Tetrahymena thermophila SB210]EAS05933.2 hypothetical protein TTHERM_00790800 [Tetrahymena thermophila SB210]|eukprot:XP_001026178.2 hypothetical protein TTHERM_00790800 [Tetrahymena thermophila SB210]